MTSCASFPCQLLFLFGFLWSRARSQTPSPYASLVPTPFINTTNGVFEWPKGAGAAAFTEGSHMNISWKTEYPAVNLWLIMNQTWDKPISIASNYAGLSQEWIVDCHDNCSVPFLLRAVNAAGSAAEESGGGFFSRQFWINPVDSFNSATMKSASSVSTTGDLNPTALHSTSSTRESTTTSASTGSSTSRTDGGSGSSTHGTSIGVGVGVGVGAALLLVGGFFLWRRYHKKMKAKYSRPPAVDQQEPRPSWPQPPSMFANSNHFGTFEMFMPENKRAEAPDRQFDPQELPGHTN